MHFVPKQYRQKGFGLALLKILLTLPLLLFAMQSEAGIKFIPNHGQWESNVLYRGDIPGGEFFLEKTGLTYFFYDEGALHRMTHNGSPRGPIKCHVVKVDFVNSQEPTAISGDSISNEYYNYIIGNDPSKWASHVHAAGLITLSNLWPGIDMQIASHDQAIKYTFIVHPKADPSLIQLHYRGASDVVMQEDGVHVNTTLTNLIEWLPVAYAEDKHANKENVNVSFKLQGETLGFDVAHYNRRHTLVIDPTLVFSTFSGSVADNFGFTATYNHSGNAFSGGTVYAQGFPTTTGAFQKDYQGGVDNYDQLQFACDAGILKYSPDGKQLVWATYVGGSNNEEPHSMVVNSKDQLVIFGTTFSNNFPMAANSYDNSYNGNGDIFLVTLSEDGSSLAAATFLGGPGRDGLNGNTPDRYPSGPLAYNYGDQFRGEVIVDSSDNVFIATCTQSSNFPIVSGFQKSFGGGIQDGIVVSLTPNLNKIRWSSFIGGSDQDAAYGINMDGSNNVYVCGGTMSQNFPTSSNAKWRSYMGDRDGFVMKISPDGSQILASTLVGTGRYDQCYFVQMDGQNNVYVTGQTVGPFPVSNDVYRNTGGTQFIAAFKNDLSDIVLSTVFGSGRNSVDISPSAFLVDLCGRVYVCGWGGGDNSYYNPVTGSTTNMPLTRDAFQRSTDGSDFYLIILSKQLRGLVYASYFGGPVSEEHVDGGTSRFDRDGKVYEAVCGGCGGFSDFPTTPGAWSRVNRGRRPHNPQDGGCNNALFKLDLNSSNFAPQFQDTTLVVTATDEITYDFTVVDRDGSDSIYLTYSGDVFDPKKVTQPTASLKADNGVGIIQGEFHWQTNCGHRSTDTFVVNVTVRDNGCPTPRVTHGKIKIVVKSPPIPDPPAIFCIDRLNSSTLKINWDEFKVDRFLANYKLVKIYPDGHQVVLKTITSRADKSYTDYDAADHLVKDYCYYIYGTNICGDTGTHTRTICSIPDKDSIPKAVNMYTVSVENDQYLRVTWNKYIKNDFYFYLVYKKENTDQGNNFYRLYKYVKDANDTTFLDSNVDVHSKSYCYKIIVQNQCGLQSPNGNYGCSILLTGTSVPFEHHLSWNTYKLWNAGVDHYEIIRWDPSKPKAVIGTNSNLVQSSTRESYVDDTLDYDMGLYHYQVRAYEGNGGLGATSLSNTITLIQAPIVHIPNVFTPNKDSTNDKWVLLPVFVKDYNLKVYNRWGEAVWETNDKHTSWDGLFKGYQPFDNVFIYQLKFTGWDGSTNYRKGFINILK